MIHLQKQDDLGNWESIAEFKNYEEAADMLVLNITYDILDEYYHYRLIVVTGKHLKNDVFKQILSQCK